MVFWVSQSASRFWCEHVEQPVLGIGRDFKRYRGGVFLEPVAMAGARNRHDIGRPRQNPGNRQLGWGALLDCGKLLELLDQLEVTAHIVGLKARHVASCVAHAQRRDIADLASQETSAQGAVGDKADVEFLAKWQDLGLDIAGPQ